MSEVITGQIKIRKLVIGIGGTGTSDFGLGMASAFGLKLLDKNSIEMDPIPANFCRTADIIWEKTVLPFETEVILDVDIPLLGNNGASRTFGPQKGATASEVEILEQGISNLLQILGTKFPEGAGKSLFGAGGGIAAAFHYFFDAKYKFAKDFLHEDLMISREINPDLVITGEGTFDSQSYFMKGAMIIIEEFVGTGVPVFTCAGSIQGADKLEKYGNLFFIDISSHFPNKNESIKNIKKGIKIAAEEVLKYYFSGNISS